MSRIPKMLNESSKKRESRAVSSSPSDQTSAKKQHRKAENPNRLSTNPMNTMDFRNSSLWICKNSACKAVLSICDTFCRRCSCCICHLFDDNKDPSLWLVCSTESGQEDSCGLSCHIECAFQRKKVGVVDLGHLMQLDGSYCCASCGRVSSMIGCWKRQLVKAEDARRIDVLCHRIDLSYRLLDGTSRFIELHEIVKDMKAKLETEVGPVNGLSAKMARGIVCRLSVAGDLQKLCSLAIERADKLLAAASAVYPSYREDSLPAACKFLFEEITSSSVLIILIEPSNASSDSIKGYKLWYCRSGQDAYTKDPICVFPRVQRRILISKLQACTEYRFKIILYSENCDLGHSEAKCFTKSAEIVKKNSISALPLKSKNKRLSLEGSSASQKGPHNANVIASSFGFKVREMANAIRLSRDPDEGFVKPETSEELLHPRLSLEGSSASQKGPHNANVIASSFGFKVRDMANAIRLSRDPDEGFVKPETSEELLHPVTRGLDLNVVSVSVPDLNEDITLPFEFSRDEDDGCTLQDAMEADGDSASREIEKKGLARSHGSGDSQTWTCGPAGEVPAVDSWMKICRKRTGSKTEEIHDCDSTLINSSPFRISNRSSFLDENFEYCVKIIRWLECKGHIKHEFRLKLLTWFSLRSTEQERRVVNTFIQTLIDDPSSLAGQLIDSFSDIISCKRPRNGLCSKLWH